MWRAFCFARNTFCSSFPSTSCTSPSCDVTCGRVRSATNLRQPRFEVSALATSFLPARERQAGRAPLPPAHLQYERIDVLAVVYFQPLVAAQLPKEHWVKRKLHEAEHLLCVVREDEPPVAGLLASGLSPSAPEGQCGPAPRT